MGGTTQGGCKIHFQRISVQNGCHQLSDAPYFQVFLRFFKTKIENESYGYRNISITSYIFHEKYQMVVSKMNR